MPENTTTPKTDTQDVTALRLQLLENGYHPIPNKDKACYVKNWPKMSTDATAIAKWGRSRKTLGTGIRVEGGLCVIDIDVDHEAIYDVIEAMLDVVPESLHLERLERSGKGYKIAWYVRCNELFTRLHTRRWTAPDTVETDDRTHSIEIFGGASPRQFGSFGPHTLAEDGSVEIEYTWADETPADVPLGSLPLVTKTQLFNMLDAAETALVGNGFEPVARSKSGEGSPEKIYDLTEDMIFELNDGQPDVTLDQLTEMVENGYEGRCSASWMGDISPNRTRCIIGRNHNHELTIWETSTGNTHMRQVDGPTPRDAILSKLHKGLGSLVQDLPDTDRQRINAAQAEGVPVAVGPDDYEDDGVDGAYDSDGNPIETPRGGMVYAQRPDLRLSLDDDMDTKVGKLLSAYGFREGAAKCVVPLWRYENDPTDLAMSMAALREACMPFREEGEEGPRGGKPPMISPADIWLCSVRKTLVHGARVRVDRQLPTFTEDDGTVWVNAYCPVDFGSAEGGDENTILDFIEHLLPDDRELDWFMKWLAYKFQNPAIPGPAVVMVAREYGTGRGTLTKLITKLFGIRMVARVDFARYAGMNYQSQYTSWACGKLFAVVDESPAATAEVSSYQARADIYERIKEVIEPAPTLREYIFKGTTDEEVVQLSAMTSLIMTNNPNAIPLPDKDRRIAVLTNGDIGAPEFWARVGASLDRKVDVAAFAEYLRTYDTAEYSPYAPPIMTDGKRLMTELNKTGLDQCVDEAMSKMVGPFHIDQVKNHIARYASLHGTKLPDAWKAIVDREIATRAARIRHPKSYRHTTVVINDKTHKLYAKTRAEADTLMERGVVAFRDEIDANDLRGLGDVADAGGNEKAASPVVVTLKRS